MLSWALNDVFKLNWLYPAKSSFGIRSSRESATMEVLKSLIPSRSLSPSFPLIFFILIFFNFLLILKLFKKRKRKKNPKWRHFSTFNDNSQLNSNEIPHWQKLKVRRLKWQKLKIRVLKWKMLKIRGSVLDFCQLFIMVSGCHLLVSDYRYQEWHSLKALLCQCHTPSQLLSIQAYDV